MSNSSLPPADQSSLVWQRLKDTEKKLDGTINQVEHLISERKSHLAQIDSLKKRLQSDTVATIQTLESISSLIVKNDSSYAGKVAKLAKAICEEMKLGKDEILRAEIYAKLHLTGLLVSNPEKDEFKFYPGKSVFIFENISAIKNMASVFLDLDEFFDGSGPNSKKGRGVAPEIRAVRGSAFFYHLYFKELSNKQILNELDKHAGTVLDPNVVSVLYKVLLRKEFYSGLGIRTLNLSKLSAGMKLESGIFSQRGAMLLPAGTILTDALIDKVLAYDKGESVIENILIRK